MSLDGARLRYEDENGKVVVLAAKGRTFQVGSYFNCDLTIEDPQEERLLCEIKCDAFGRVNIYNKSSQEPIHLNDQVFHSCNGKRPLLHGCRITIRDKVYIWEFPKTSEAQDEPSTPKSTTSTVEQASNSCPAPKQSHRLQIDKRLTVHNFHYSINSDDEGNTSIESRDQNESLLEEDSLDFSTPSSSNTTACETPKVNLLEATQNKENTATPPGSHQKLLQLCALSDVVITSFSPRETGVKVEKSFTCVRKPVKAAKTVSTPKSVYSTPKGGVLSELNEDSCSRDLMDFCTPSTSKKARRASSMHMIDLTTPSKLRPTPKQTPTSITVDSTDESSDASPLVIDITNSATPPSSGPLHRNNTPRRPGGTTGATPKRTPQSLMKRALLTSTKKQITANQTDKTTPVANAKRTTPPEARRQCLTTPRRLPFHPVRRTPLQRPEEKARSKAPNTSPRKRKTLLESPRDNKVSQLRKSFAAAKRSPGVDKSNKLVAKARRSLNSPKSGSPKPASPCPRKTFNLPRNKCSTPEKLDDSKDELSRTFTIIDETEGREQSEPGSVIEAVSALITGDIENDVSIKLAPEVFDNKISSVEEQVKSISPANEKTNELKSEVEKVNSKKDDVLLENEPNDVVTAHLQELSKSPSDANLQDEEKIETLSIQVKEKTELAIIEDSICDEVHATIPKQTNAANPHKIFEDNICEEVLLETKSADEPVKLGDTSTKRKEQTANVDTPSIRRSLRKLSVDQRAVTTTPRRSTRRSSVDANKKVVSEDNSKRTRRASCSAVESQDVSTPRRKRRFTQEMSTPTRQSKRLMNTPKRENQVDESVGDMGVILEEGGPVDEENSAIADDENYGNELPVDNTDNVDYHGLKDLLKTPKNCSTPRFKGLREMMRTPKNPASPILGNLAELLETSAGSTPYHKGKSSTAADVEQGKTLEEILKTPSARNIMVPIEPASAVLKSREGSLAATTEYDLNMTNTTLHLDKIFDDVPETTGPNMEDTEAEINVTALSTATGVDPLGSSKLNKSVSSEALMTDCNTATGASFKDPLTSTTYKASMQTDLNLSAFTDTGSRTASPNPNEMSGIQLLDQTSDSMFCEPLIVTGVESSDVTVDETRASSQTIPPADNIEDRSDTDSNVGLTEPLVFSDDEEESEKSETTPKKHICFGETSTAYKLQESGDLRGNKSVTETSVNDKKMDSVSEVSLIEVKDTTIEGSSISVSKPVDDVTQDEKSLVIELDKFRDKGEPGQENNESAVVELTILESEIFPLDSTAGCSVISSNVSNCSEVDLPNVDLKPLDSKTTNLGDVKTTEVSIEGTKEDDFSHLDMKFEHEKTTDVKTDQPVTEKSFTERVAKECKDLSLENTAETNDSKLTSEKRPGKNKPDEGASDAATDQLVIKTSPVHEHPEEHIDADQPIIKTSISEKHSENPQSDEVSTDVITAPAEKLSEKSQSDLPLEKQTDAETDQLVIETTPADEFPEESKPEKTTDSETDQLVIETSPSDEPPEESTSDLLLEKKPDGENESTHTEVLLEESTTSAARGDSEVLGQTQELLPKNVIQNCGSCPIGDTSISKAIDEDSAIDRNESVVDTAEDSGALSKSQEKQENSAKEETSINETAKYKSSPSSTVEIEHSEVVDSPEKSTEVDNATPTKGGTPTPRDISVTDKNNDDQLNGATAADQSSDKQEHLNEKSFGKDIIEGVPKDSISETSRNINSPENLQGGIQEPSSPKSEPDSKAFKSTPLVKNVLIEEEEEEEPSKEVTSAQEAEKSCQTRPKEEIHMAESSTDYQTSKDECSQIDERITDQVNEDSILEGACGQPKVPSDQEETDSVVVQLDATKSVFEQTTLNECSLMEDAGENQSNEDSYMEESSGSHRTNGDQGEAEKCEPKEALNETEDEVILDGSSLTEDSASDQPKDVSILSEPSCFEKTKEDKKLNKEEVKEYGPDDEVIQLDASSIVNQTPVDESLLASDQFNEECILEDKPKMSGTMNKEEDEKCVPKESPNQNGPDNEVIELDTSNVVEDSLIECSVTEEHNKDFTSVESSNFDKTRPISVTEERESETTTGKSCTDHGVEVVVQNIEIKSTEKPADLHNSTDTESHKETDEQLSFVKKSSVNECYQDVLSVTAEVSTSAPEITLNVSNSNIQVIIAAQADNSKRAANYIVRQTEGDVPSAKAEEQEALVQETEKDEGEIIGELKELPKAQQQIDEKLSLQKKISEVIQSEKYEVIDLDDSSSSAQGPETMPHEAFENKESDAPKASSSFSVSAALLDTEPQVSDKLAQPKLVEELVTAAKKNDKSVTTHGTTLNELKEEGVAPPTLTTLQTETIDQRVAPTEKYDVIDLDDSSSSAQGPETSSLEKIDEIEFVGSKESTSASMELATEEPEEPNNLTDPAFAKESDTFTTSKDNLDDLQKDEFAPSEPKTKPIITDEKVALTEQLDVIDLDDSSSSAQGPETRPIEAIEEKESFASNTSTSTGVLTEQPQLSQQADKPLLAKEFVTVTATDPVPAKESVTMTSAKKIEVKATTYEDHFDNIEKADFAPSESKTKPIITDEKVALTEQLDVIDLDDSSSSAQEPETRPIEAIEEKESFASNTSTLTGVPTEQPQGSQQVAKPLPAKEFVTVIATDPVPAKEFVTMTSAKKIEVKATTSEDHFDNIEKADVAPSEPKTKPIITDEKVALTEQLDVIDLDDSSSSAQGPKTTPIEDIKEKESFASNARTSTGQLPTENPQVSEQVAKPVLAEEFNTVTATKNSDLTDPAPAKESDTLTSAKRIGVKATTSEDHFDNIEKDNFAPFEPKTKPIITDEKVALTEKLDVIDLDDSSSSAQGADTTPIEAIKEKESELPIEKPQVSKQVAKPVHAEDFDTVIATKGSDEILTTSEATLDTLEEDGNAAETESVTPKDIDEKVTLTEKYDIIDLDDSSSSAQAPETKPLDTVDKKEFVASNSNTFVNVSVALPTEETQASDELAKEAPVAESKRRIKTSKGTLDNLKKERIASPEPDTVQEIQDQEKLDKSVVGDHTAEELSAQSKEEHGNIKLISETAKYAVLLTQEAPSSNDNPEQSQINTEKKSKEELDHSTSTGLNTGNKDNILQISKPSISSDKTKVPRQVCKPLNDEVISSDEIEAKPAKRATRKGSASSDRPAEATGSERMKRRARKPSAEVEEHEKDNKQEDYVYLKPRGRARKPSSEVDESQGDDKTEKRKGRGHTPSAEASELIQQEENVEEHKAEENLEPIFEEAEPGVEREESTEGEDNNKKEPTNKKTKKRGRKPLAIEPDATIGKNVNTGDVLEGVHDFENPHEDLSDQAEQQEHQKPVPVVSTNVLKKETMSKLENEEDHPNQKAITIEKSKRRGRKASAKETDTTSGKKGKTEHVVESVNEDGISHSNREQEPVPVLSPASNEEEEAKTEVESKQDPREDKHIKQKNTIIEKPKRRGRKPSAKETVTSLDRNEKAKDNLKTPNQYHLDDSVQEEPQEPMPVEALNLFKEDQETKTEVGPNAYPEKPSRRARKASEDVSIVPDKKHKSEELPSIEKHNNESKESVKEDLTEVRVERSKRRGRKLSAEEVKATGSNQQNDGIEEMKVYDAIASIQEENKLHSGARKSAEFIPANVQEPVKEDHIERPKRRGRKPSVDIDNVGQQNQQTDDVEEIKVENALTSIQEENKPHSRARKSAEFIPANVQEPAKEDHIERPKRRGRKPSVDIDHVAREVVENPKRRGRTPAEHEKQLNEDEKQERALQIVEPEKKTRRNTRKASAETAEAVSTSGEDHLQQIKEATEPGSESEPTPTKTKEEEEHKTRRRGHKPTAETIEEPIKKNSPEIPSHSRRRGRKTSEDETLTTADIAEPKTKLRGGRVSLDQEQKEEIQLEVVELPPAKTTRRGRKPSAEVEMIPVTTPEKKPSSRRIRNASANIDEGTPVAKKSTNRRGRKEDALDEEPINQIDLQDLPTDSVPATVVTSSSPAKTSDGEELTPRRREGRNLPRKNYEEAPDDEKPHSASRRARKPAASKGLANTAPEPDALTATPVSKQPPIEEDVTPANTGAMPEPTTSQRREGRNLPRKNYTEAPDDDKPTTARGRRVRNLTAKALELIVDSSPRPATPKRPKGKAIEDEGAPAKATQEILPAAEGTTPEDELVPAAKGRGTRRKADEVGEVSAPASKRGGRGNHSETDESDQKPAKKNVRATARKAKVETDPEEHPPTKRARGGARAKTPVAVTEESASNQEGEPLKKPAARSRARGAKAAEPEQPHQDSQVEVAASTSATTVRGGRGRKVHFEAAPEVSTSEDAPKRATRSRRK